jgi:hypothetical protein
VYWHLGRSLPFPKKSAIAFASLPSSQFFFFLDSSSAPFSSPSAFKLKTNKEGFMQLSASELSAPHQLNQPLSTPVISINNEAHPIVLPPPQRTLSSGGRSTSPGVSMSGSFDLGGEEEMGEDWGGDLMDVNDDEGDWGTFFSSFLSFLSSFLTLSLAFLQNFLLRRRFQFRVTKI